MIKSLAVALSAALAMLGLTACVPEAEPTPVQPTEAGAPKAGSAKSAGAKPKSSKPVPIKLTAKRIAYPKAQFAISDGPFSCVKATVTNQTAKTLQINPLYFTLTDTGGNKRTAELGVADGQFEVLTLAPREKASGVVCVKGTSKPATISFTDPLFSDAARARVAA